MIQFVKFSRSASLALAMCVTVGLSLGACQMIEGPGPLPTGYVHHKGTNNVPPGGDPGDIGYTQKQFEVSGSETDWKIAARDLLHEMMRRNAISTGPVFVATNRQPTSLDNTFDDTLRGVLRNTGIMLASSPEGVPVLTYETKVYMPEEQEEAMKPVGTASNSYMTSREKPSGKADADEVADTPDYVSLAPVSLVETESMDQPEYGLEEPVTQENQDHDAPQTMKNKSHVMITLNVLENGVVKATESGVYDIPEAGDYTYVPRIPNPPVVGEK